MSFLGDPRNMAEINKDELKNIDIYYILPDNELYSGILDEALLMERIMSQVENVTGEPIYPSLIDNISSFIAQLMLDANSMISTSAPAPVTTTAPESWCPYSTHDGCGCPPGKAWNYKGLFKILACSQKFSKLTVAETLAFCEMFVEIFNILNIRTNRGTW